jgi:hypothetical protein
MEGDNQMQTYEDKPGSYRAQAADYPPASDVLNTDLSAETLAEWYLQDFPRGTSAAAQQRRAEAIAQYRASLTTDAARYEDIRSRGAEALSRYDVDISASGDADAAVRMALSLKYNHVMYNLRCLEAARRMAPALFAFVESGATVTRREIIPQSECEQLALF